MSQSMALYSIIIAQGTSVAGRLIISTMALRLGVMIPWLTCALASGVLNLGWIGIRNVGGFITFAALYGKEKHNIPPPPALKIVWCLQ